MARNFHQHSTSEAMHTHTYTESCICGIGKNLHHICSRSATSNAYTLRIFKHIIYAQAHAHRRKHCGWTKKQINKGIYLHTFSTITNGNSSSMHVLCTYLFSILFQLIFCYCLCLCLCFFFCVCAIFAPLCHLLSAVVYISLCDHCTFSEHFIRMCQHK